MDELFGLPAHPLIVHGAVVLVPLAALGTVLIAVSSSLRRRLGVAVAVLAVVAFGFTVLAKESGESLEERVDEDQAVEEHAELGEVMPLFAGALMLTSVGLVVLDEAGRRWGARSGAGSEPDAASDRTSPGWLKPATTAVAVLAVVTSIGAMVQVVEVGHSGAAATWEDEGRGEGDEHEGGDERERDEDQEDGMADQVVVVVGSQEL